MKLFKKQLIQLIEINLRSEFDDEYASLKDAEVAKKVRKITPEEAYENVTAEGNYINRMSGLQDFNYLAKRLKLIDDNWEANLEMIKFVARDIDSVCDFYNPTFPVDDDCDRNLNNIDNLKNMIKVIDRGSKHSWIDTETGALRSRAESALKYLAQRYYNIKDDQLKKNMYMNILEMFNELYGGNFQKEVVRDLSRVTDQIQNKMHIYINQWKKTQHGLARAQKKAFAKVLRPDIAKYFFPVHYVNAYAFGAADSAADVSPLANLVTFFDRLTKKFPAGKKSNNEVAAVGYKKDITKINDQLIAEDGAIGLILDGVITDAFRTDVGSTTFSQAEKGHAAYGGFRKDDKTQFARYPYDEKKQFVTKREERPLGHRIYDAEKYVQGHMTGFDYAEFFVDNWHPIGLVANWQNFAKAYKKWVLEGIKENKKAEIMQTITNDINALKRISTTWKLPIYEGTNFAYGKPVATRGLDWIVGIIKESLAKVLFNISTKGAEIQYKDIAE